MVFEKKSLLHFVDIDCSHKHSLYGLHALVPGAFLILVKFRQIYVSNSDRVELSLATGVRDIHSKVTKISNSCNPW